MIISIETIREWLNRRPFDPFVLRLSKGKAYEVQHPENVALGKTRLAVIYPETDRFVHVSLIHINSIEALQAT